MYKWSGKIISGKIPPFFFNGDIQTAPTMQYRSFAIRATTIYLLKQVLSQYLSTLGRVLSGFQSTKESWKKNRFQTPTGKFSNVSLLGKTTQLP